MFTVHARMSIRLTRRKEVLRPTWIGWLAIAASVILALRLVAPLAFDFLSPSSDGRADYLAVEGWIPDYAVPAMVSRIETRAYRRVFTTGVPIEQGSYLLDFGSYADVAKASLEAAGASADAITSVRAPTVRKDRTFAAATALRDRLAGEGIVSGTVALATVDTHALRSRMLFRRALGDGFRVETVPYPNPRYSRGDWWTSSEGFRAVVYEGLALVYTLVRAPGPESESLKGEANR